ncbi:MAG: DUF2975 domain-containing protein [Oscillospiraceae bacterium]|nr:DUF2975 domain-containing protein [Oscillospiraceae bacterium]
MSKVKDINERTLEKEKKDFTEFCKFAEGMLTAIMALIIVGAAALFIVIIMDNAMKNLTYSSSSKYTTAGGIFYGVYDLISMLCFAVALNFGVKAFKKLKDGETPFRYEIADKIKAAGIVLFATGFFSIAAGIVEGVLESTGVIVVTDSSLISIDLSIFMWGAVLFAVAYIFNYGCKLQQESDETL